MYMLFQSGGFTLKYDKLGIKQDHFNSIEQLKEYCEKGHVLLEKCDVLLLHPAVGLGMVLRPVLVSEWSYLMFVVIDRLTCLFTFIRAWATISE